MSHYDEVLKEARAKATGSAKEYIPKLFHILVDEEKRSPDEARAIIEHDLISYWAKATVTKFLPIEAKDESKVKAGKEGAKATNLVLAGGQTQTQTETVTTPADDKNPADDEDPKDQEISYWKEKATELEDAMHKISDKQFVQATQLENKPSRPDFSDDTVFKYLKDRAKETGDILDFGRVGSGALVQVLTQYKGSFGVVELFGRIVKK